MGEVVETGAAPTPSSGRAIGSSSPSASIAASAGSASSATIRSASAPIGNAAMAAAQFGDTDGRLIPAIPTRPAGYSRRASRICARADGRCRADESAGTEREDEEVLFLTDIFPDRLSGRRAGRHQGRRDRGGLGHRPRRACSPSSPAKVLGAERIIAIETVPERIAMARKAGARTSSISRKRMSSSGSRRSAKARAPMW